MISVLVNLPQASTIAGSVDTLYNFIFYFSLASFVLIVAAATYFSLKYRRRGGVDRKTPYIIGHTPTEVGVSLFLFVIVMVIFYWGWKDYQKIITPPAGSLEINVVGRQWLWNFEYTNGRKMTNEIVVPKEKPVRLIMTSADVLHSFYVPAFRLKQDLIPNAHTELWFNAIEEGEYDIFCAEYCGAAHSKMLGKIKVVDPKEYERWHLSWELAQRSGEAESEGKAPSEESLADRGKRLFSEKGCTACHTATTTQLIGPGLQGIFGHDVELSDGSTVQVDENYIRESMTDPQLKLVKGFQPLMPTYKGTLSDEEMNALVGFIKSLK